MKLTRFNKGILIINMMFNTIQDLLVLPIRKLITRLSISIEFN